MSPDRRYHRRLRSVGKVDPEHERELWRRWSEEGDRRARDELVVATLRHVIPIASRYRSAGEPFDDLVSEGSLGVMHALRKYDPDKGTRFSTYARLWVRAYVGRYVRRCRSLVSTPLYDQAWLVSKAAKMRRQLAVRDIDGEAANRIVAKELDMTVDALRSLEERFGTRDVSFEAPRSGNPEISFGEMLPNPGPNPYELVAVRELNDILDHAIESAELSDVERTIMRKRLLTPPGDEPSLADLGRELNMSREWARRLEQRGMRKLESVLAAAHKRSA